MRVERQIRQGLRQLKALKPDPLWQKETGTYLLNYFKENSPSLRVWGFYFTLKPVLVTSVVLVILLLTGFSTLYAVKGSLPGDSFYPVKRFSEKVKIYFTFDRGEKTILRAEILTTRISEAKILANKLDLDKKDTQKVAPKLVAATRDLHRELIDLRKEIVSQIELTQDIDVTFDEGSLPIQDGRQVVKILQSADLQKTLEQTKALLKEKNLVTALAKTTEVEKYLTQPVRTTTTTPETIEPLEESKETPQLPLKQKQIIPTGSISTPAKQILEPISPDFQIDLEREEPVKINPIRE